MLAVYLHIDMKYAYMGTFHVWSELEIVAQCAYIIFMSFPGFSNPGVGTILFELGPDCACSNRQALELVVRRFHDSISTDMSEDTQVISKAPITEWEIQALLQVGGEGRGGKGGREGPKDGTVYLTFPFPHVDSILCLLSPRPPQGVPGYDEGRDSCGHWRAGHHLGGVPHHP